MNLNENTFYKDNQQPRTRKLLKMRWIRIKELEE